MNKTALDLLYKASFLPAGHFLCFGIHYHQLKKLDLIDGENQVTYTGRQFIKYAIKKGYLK